MKSLRRKRKAKNYEYLLAYNFQGGQGTITGIFKKEIKSIKTLNETNECIKSVLHNQDKVTIYNFKLLRKY